MLAALALATGFLVPSPLRVQSPRAAAAARVRHAVMTVAPSEMRVKEIKAELVELGVSTADCFEKDDLVAKLVAARLAPPPPAAAAPAPPSPAPSPPPPPPPPSAPSVDREAVRAEIAGMKVKEIRAELTSLGADTRGLLEKDEFVTALLSAREAAADRQVADEDVVEAQTTKMPKAGAAPQGGMPGGVGGMGGMGGMPGGMGGMPGGMGGLGDILGGMAGGGGGMPGGMGGLGDILGKMGGMGGMPGGAASGGAAPGGMPGGMGGMGGMGDMLSKMMSNPRAMELMQKAQQNPKIMKALQDVQTNGPGAMAKYANDPEIMEVVKELQSIMG